MALEDTNGYVYMEANPFSYLQDATQGEGYSSGLPVDRNMTGADIGSGISGIISGLTGALLRRVDVETSIRLNNATQPAVAQGTATSAGNQAGTYYQVPKPSQDLLLIGIAVLAAVLIWKS